MADITGVVTIGPSETPGEATVLLFNEPGDTIIASTTSNASTGAYSFTGIPAGLQYRVVVMGNNVYRSRGYGPCHVGDLYWDQVVTMLHLNGSDGAISFTDEKGKTWSASGNAQIDTAQKKFGASSLLLDGTGDLISSGDHADWSFGSGDFTVEAFVRFNAVSGSAVIAGHYNLTGNQREWLFWHDFTNSLLSFTYSVDGTAAPAVQFAWSPVANTWYHVAVSRVGNTIYLFVDGVLKGSSAFNFTLFNSTASLTVGHAGTSANALNGWVDEFRITKGVGRYSATFTAPISPFSNVQGVIPCVWDAAAAGSGVSLTSGNLRASKAGAGWATVLGTVGKSSGKWQFEIVGRSATIYMFAGLADKSNLAGALATYIGDNSGVVETAGYWNNGFEYHRLSSTTGNSARTSWTNNDIITITLDLTVPEARFYKNGAFIFTLALPAGKTWFPATSVQNGGTVDFVPSGLTYPQSGFTNIG